MKDIHNDLNISKYALPIKINTRCKYMQKLSLYQHGLCWGIKAKKYMGCSLVTRTIS